MSYIFALFNYDNIFNKNFVEINLIFLLETSSHLIKHEEQCLFCWCGFV